MKKYISLFLIFFLLFCLPLPAFAAEVIDLPSDIPLPTYADILNVYNPQDYDGLTFTDYDYIVYYYDYDDSWRCNVIFDNSSNFYLYNDSRFLVSSYSDPWDLLMMLKYVDGVWISNGSSFVGSNGVTIDGVRYGGLSISGDVAYSTKTIYYFGTDDVFFYQLPTLTEAAGEALTQFQIQTTQTIMTILLCGVGCLALLISLPLLKKVLLRFLNR